ncbi:MAG: hypothetical protein HYW24_05390 [Candidatus Aenigmarchaeota archaeon]|nr:hypothetical protein [Candidatus Aenigmarchaeota archaeon]
MITQYERSVKDAFRELKKADPSFRDLELGYENQLVIYINEWMGLVGRIVARFLGYSFSVEHPYYEKQIDKLAECMKK